MRQHESNVWRVLNLGQQSEADVSQCLLTADFGVSAAPPENVFKSGTATAMIEHGCPFWSRVRPRAIAIARRKL